MGEDVEFYWKMKHWAKKRLCTVSFIDAVSVVPSMRRYDQWPTWKTFLLTNPLFIGLFRKTPKAWSGWYLARRSNWVRLALRKLSCRNSELFAPYTTVYQERLRMI